MFKFLYRSRKPVKSHTTPPAACLEDVRTWRVTGNPTLLQKALNAGLDIKTSVDDKLGNPLHVAAHQSYLESLFLLHARGMRDDVHNPQGNFAVHLAAAAGFRDGLLYILKNMGADIDARSGQGATPLMLAVQNDHLDVASALLARGARVGRPTVSVGTEEGRGVGDASIAVIHLCKSPGMLRLLLTTTTLHVDTRSAEGMTLLHVCSAAGDTVTAAECLALGANCKAVDHNHANALHYACRNRSAHIIPLLIKAGCSSSEPDAGGFTPVEVALLRQDCDTAYALYCSGALFTKRQLLLLSILLRHSSLLKAIRSERDLTGHLNHTTKHSGSGTSLDESASKVETQAAALLAGPSKTNLNQTASSLSLSSLVVSVGQVPTANDVTADNFSTVFQHMHDPVPRPMGTSTSTVLVSVYSRFLRHSDSSVPGTHAAWRGGASAGLQHQQQPAALAGLDNDVDFSDPSCKKPVIAHRHSESVAMSDSVKKGFWTSTAGHPDGASVAMRFPQRQHSGAKAAAERLEAADKLDSVEAAGGRSSLERLLPHYLLGLTPFGINQAANNKPDSIQASSPSPAQSQPKAKPAPAVAVAGPPPASSSLADSSAATLAPVYAQKTPSLQASSPAFAPSAIQSHSTRTGAPSAVPSTDARAPPPPASLPLRATHAQPSTSRSEGCYSAVLPPVNSFAPPATVVAPPPGTGGAAGAAAQHEHSSFAPPRRAPRRSFCGDPPPEAFAFSEGTRQSTAHNGDMDQLMQDHRSRAVRKSSFFTRGRTTPNDPSNLMTRRSQTFDWGYCHSEMVGVPVSRGRWGQPQALPGPGGASGNPNTQAEPSAASQDDTALSTGRAELPTYGQDLAVDGMLEFEEMMARRVQLFQGGGGPQRRGGDEGKPSRHIDCRTVAGLESAAAPQ